MNPEIYERHLICCVLLLFFFMPSSLHLMSHCMLHCSLKKTGKNWTRDDAFFVPQLVKTPPPGKGARGGLSQSKTSSRRPFGLHHHFRRTRGTGQRWRLGCPEKKRRWLALPRETGLEFVDIIFKSDNEPALTSYHGGENDYRTGVFNIDLYLR